MKRRWAAGVAALALLAAACGDDDADAGSTGGDSGAVATEAPAEAASGDLTSACPDPLVVQTDWYPSPEHAYLYGLIGDAGELDAESGVYRGPLGDTGIDLEIRAGGPYLGFQATTAIMYADDSIHLGYVSLDEAIQVAGAFPTVAVAAPLEINPQILMWDPEAVQFESFADIGESDSTVLYFADAAYVDYLVATGQLRAEQLDSSYDGAPARFVTEGPEGLVQQGFATSEPFRYENELGEWGKPVDYLLVHDSGYETYSQALAGRPEVVSELAECLEAVVPLVQQSVVDHVEDPQPTNDLILQIVEDLASSWVLTEGQMEYSVETAVELGVYSNGTNDTVGDLDPERVASFTELLVPLMNELGKEVPADLDPESLYTNEFTDPAIGFDE